MSTRTFLQLFIVLAVAVVIGCSSSSSNAVLPGGDSDILNINQNEITKEESGRELWGVWRMKFDFEAGSVAVEPIREVTHYQIRSLLVPSIHINSFNPVTQIVDVNVTFNNVYQLDGYDVRLIIYTDNKGHLLLNADDWTSLFDAAGGESINPFKAYAKDKTGRKFARGTIEMENLLIYLPNLEPSVYFAIDASWPSNCKEPYSIENFSQDRLFDTPSSSAEISVDVLDWQNDVSFVKISCPEVTGVQNIGLNHATGNTWSLIMTNQTGAQLGEYPAIIHAVSSNSSSLYLYEKVNIIISESANCGCEPDFPKIIDSIDTGGSTQEVEISGSYLYVADSTGYFRIFDISLPGGPVERGSINVLDQPHGLAISGNYANVADYYSGLRIIDIHDADNPFQVALMNTAGQAVDVVVKGNYSYIADGTGGLKVIDCTVPSLPKEILTRPTNNAVGLTIASNYLYVADDYWGMKIFDISNPMDTVQIGMVNISGQAYDIAVSDGFAYVASFHGGLVVVDISDPYLPAVVSSLTTFDAIKIVVSCGFAYITTGYQMGMKVIDIANPYSPVQKSEITFGTHTRGVAKKGDYSYIAASNGGLKVVRNCGNMTRIALAGEPHGVKLSGDYAFVTSWDAGLHIVDISNPLSPHLEKTVDTPGHSTRCDVDSDYAYVADSEGGLAIVDISPIPDAHIVKTVPMPQYCYGVDVYNGYAYTANEYAGCFIVDVSPVDSSYIVRQIDTPGNANNVAYAIGYIYCADCNGGLHIIDAEPPLEASIVKTVDMPDGWATGVYFNNGYVYVADGIPGVRIVDVIHPLEANVVRTVDTPGAAYDVYVTGSNCYVADSQSGLQILDVQYPQIAYITGSVEIDTGLSISVEVRDGYAYVANDELGLIIISL